MSRVKLLQHIDLMLDDVTGEELASIIGMLKLGILCSDISDQGDDIQKDTLLTAIAHLDLASIAVRRWLRNS